MVWHRYDPALGRFLSVDPLADQYPGISPYVYALNNPLIFIDPDGREVRCSNEEECERLVADIQELYEDAPVGYELRTKTSSFFGLWKKTTEYYAITVDGESDFNWAQDDYASALYDVIMTEEAVYDVVYSETFPGPVGNTTVSGQVFRGGRFVPGGQNPTVYVDPRGDTRTGIPSSILLMHELIGHGHPVGSNIAHHDINYFYEGKLSIRRSANYVNTYNENRQPGQGPYRWNAPRLRKTGLYKK